jgi:HAE1 family hydrophobic/amphiphilic exporter-1
MSEKNQIEPPKPEQKVSITRLFIKRPTLVVVFFGVLLVLGLFSYQQLSYELLPKFSVPVLTISTAYPGASPSEVETSVTKKIEDAISSVDKISSVSSTSLEGVSLVVVEFQQEAQIDVALQDVVRKVSAIKSTLPTDVKDPVVSKIALDEFPILRMGLTSSMPTRTFYQFVKDKIEPRFSKLAGVAQITLIGGDEREIKVNINQDKLRSYGLSITQIVQAVKNANLDFPTGNIKAADNQFLVRIAGKFSSVNELKALIVSRSKQGGDIRLSDIADVEDGQKEYVNMNRINGITSIGLFVNKQTDANAVEVVKLVRAEIAKMEKEFKPYNVKFDISQDASTFTVEAADAVKEDLAIAVVLVALVMLVFLHSIRSSIIVMIAIPTSLISTFGMIYAMGFTLNLMTLLGLSLAVGIWVDDSIVVLENITRRLEMGDDKITAAVRGREEIGFTALSITLVDVVVFVPLALSGGLVGNILRQFAMVIVVSTLISLLVSFMVTPVLASRFTRLEHLTKDTVIGRFGLWFEDMYDAFTKKYIELLKWALAHRKATLGIATVLFLSAFALPIAGFIGFEFMSTSDRGEFSVAIELPPGAKLAETNLTTQRAEQMILAMDGVERVSANIGASSDGFIGQTSNNISDLTVKLLPRNERKKTTDEISQDIKDKLRDIPGAKIRVNPIGLFGSADQSPIQLVVTGTDADSVKKGAAHLMDIAKRTNGTADVRLSTEDGKPETRIEVDRAKLAQFGLSIAEVGTALRVALTGDDDAKYRDGQNEYNIRVQLDEYDRSTTADVGNLTFVNSKGQVIQLNQFANIYQTIGPTKLQRRDRNTAITVMAQKTKPEGGIWAEMQQTLAKEPMPIGTSIVPIGNLKNGSDSNSSLGLSFLAGILFMYMIMVALYNSYIYPFVVLFSIPLAIIGALFALGLAAKSLSIFSILGFIMLIGLVSKNAILLVDFTNKFREEGNTTYDALLEAGRERLRPILMTTLTMILGMMPIALSNAPGAEWKAGLGWALIGGLTSSMFLTLVVVPVVYTKADQWSIAVPAFFKRLIQRFSGKTEAVPETQPIAQFTETK